MKMKRFAVALLLGAGWAASSHGSTVGINFVGNAGGVVASNYNFSATDMAGVVVQANWNNGKTQTGSTTTILGPQNGILVDSTGVDSGLTISWLADGTGKAGRTEVSGDNVLMNGYLDDQLDGGDTTVTLANLNQFEAQYDIYVYFGAGADNRKATVSNGDTPYGLKTFSSSIQSFPSNYVQVVNTDLSNPNIFPNGNYAVFPGMTNDSVTISYLRNGANSGIHGIQIVPHVPVQRGNALGLNFVGNVADLADYNLAADETAGVVAQTNWNNGPLAVGATVNVGGPLNGALVDNKGLNSAVAVSWMANGKGRVGRAAVSNDNVLMNGYLDDSSTDVGNNVTIMFSNVNQFVSSYDVYVYVGAGADNRRGFVSNGTTTNGFNTYSSSSRDFPVDYTSITNTDLSDPSSFPQGNYAVFSGMTNDQFTITYERENANGGIHGIQIVDASPAESGYAAWYNFYGLVEGPEGDDDHDGLSNLYEYGLEGDPKDPGDQGEPSVYSLNEEAGTNWFVYVHPQLSDPDSGLVYYLELTDDLVSNVWTNDGYEVTGTNFVDTLDYVSNRVSTATNDQQFIQLIIEQL